MALPTVLAGEQNTGRIPSLTYTFDQENGRILRAKIDKIDAIKQFCSKALQTVRYAWLIYSFYYGSEVETLVGQNPSFVRTEVPRMIREALIYDDRITNVTNFVIEEVTDEIRVTFLVSSIFGEFEQQLIVAA